MPGAAGGQNGSIVFPFGMSADEVIAVIIGICRYPIAVGRVVELELHLGIIAEVIREQL